MNPIPKETIDRLYDLNIPKREYDKIISEIGDRTRYIWKEICSLSKRKMHWWAFSNDVELRSGDGSTGGEFDPEEYKDFIRIIGDIDEICDGYYAYDNEFPTYFLWMEDEEWQKEVLENIKESANKIKLEKEKNKRKREERKRKQAEMMVVIKNKLTKEELKYIKFK